MGEQVVGEQVVGEQVVGEQVVGEQVVGEQVVGALGLRCILVVKFSRWGRRVEKISKFCPSFSKDIVLICVTARFQGCVLLGNLTITGIALCKAKDNPNSTW